MRLVDVDRKLCEINNVKHDPEQACSIEEDLVWLFVTYVASCPGTHQKLARRVLKSRELIFDRGY